MIELILYGRKGCCLCQGLEQRLRELSLHLLDPPLRLQVIDIDDEAISNKIRELYDLQVPVLLLRSDDLNKTIEIPRVSPRLNSEGLVKWLQKSLNKFLESN